MKTIYSKDYLHTIQQLKSARIGAGLTQKESADLLGKTQSYVSKVEAGQRRIDVIELTAFCEIYKKSVKFFLRKT